MCILNKYVYLCSMIVKIFKAASSFTAVNYNERKNENGKSELLVAENFNAPCELSKKEYIAYMERVCESNQRVKNKQFHATISCKGKEYSVDQLKDIAQTFIKDMGYGKCPYLIYFHSDTENNHVHIVSTRVDKEGHKINDRMEAIRSQRVLNAILKQDLKLNADKDVKDALSYKFKSIAQFKMLLEQRGWKVYDKDDTIVLHRCGDTHYKIDINKVNFTPKSQNDLIRNKQIAALIHKYKRTNTPIELKNLMKEKFGIDLIYHYGKGKDTPYGYTIIDHQNKRVIKGSDVVDLDVILNAGLGNKDYISSREAIDMVIGSGPIDMTMNDFRASLSKLGFDVDQNYNIKPKGSDFAFDKIPFEVSRLLNRNSQLKEARQYNLYSTNEREVLKKIFYRLSSTDLESIPIDKSKCDIGYYKDCFASCIGNYKDVRDMMDKNSLSFVKLNDNTFLIDEKNKYVINTKELGLDMSLVYRNYRNPVKIADISNLSERQYEKSRALAHNNQHYSFIEAVCDAISQYFTGHDENTNKRKRRHNQQNL